MNIALYKPSKKQCWYVAVFSEALIVLGAKYGGINPLKLSKMCIFLLGSSDN